MHGFWVKVCTLTGRCAYIEVAPRNVYYVLYYVLNYGATNYALCALLDGHGKRGVTVALSHTHKKRV